MSIIVKCASSLYLVASLTTDASENTRKRYFVHQQIWNMKDKKNQKITSLVMRKRQTMDLLMLVKATT
ncbi:unnamed protein product [Ilex paraguariensis]|uniref:Secreted protein n=1 Tax=Ilex paraguariensis TaxID=185542 RepID=A0ABC8TDV1_9AQUA